MRRKTQNAYFIITLSGEKLLRLSDGTDFDLDFIPITDGERSIKSIDYRVYVSGKEPHNDNALFYQMRSLIGCGASPADRDCLEKHIVFVNFKGADLSDGKGFISRKAEALIKKGFYITFDSGEKKHFSAFDKSASMARHERISFIEDSLKDELDERITLGIPFDRFLKDGAGGTEEKIDPDAGISLSKYYAYRGLCFSGGERVEGLELNENTVIVIPDEIEKLSIDTDVLSAQSKNKNDTAWEKTIRREKIKCNFYDGEGLISPEFSMAISLSLGYSADDLSSFQIRMPFSKGVLHKVDFIGFMRDKILSDGRMAELSGCNAGYYVHDVYVTDVFGIRRSLEKARIILTESMFKCAGWLRYAKAHCGDAFEDPMKYFFEKFARYDYALYVGNTNAILRHTGKVAMNYQFFNTLKLDEAEFSAVLSDYVESAMQIEGGGKEEPDEFYPDTDFDQFRASESWEEVLEARSELRNETYIKERIRSRKRGMLDRIYKGKIEVRGELRFLSGDLLALLNHLACNCGISSGDSEAFGAAVRDIAKRISADYISPDNFYMPDSKEVCYDRRKGYSYFGILRSPHLSRYEQCALRPYVQGSGGIMTKYFGHLDGVVMVSKKGMAAAALGGADYDGDLVKVIFDERINRAILDGCYARDEESGDKSKYRRAAPYIMIPSVHKVETVKPGELKNIPFRTVRNAFSNRIGLISNAAIKIGAKEYFGTKDEQEEFKDCCAECTIATGLEIDAAKTGVHPSEYIAYLEEKANDASENNGSAEFLEVKNRIDAAHFGLCAQKPEENTEGGVTSYRFSGGVSLSDRYESAGALPRLLSGFISAKNSDALSRADDDPVNSGRVTIIPEDVDTDIPGKAEVKKIISAYLGITGFMKSFYGMRAKNDADYDGYIFTVISLHYGGPDSRFGFTEKTVGEVMAQTYSFFWKIARSNGGMDEVRRRFGKCKPKWHLTPVGEREDKLREIIGCEIPDDITKLLTDFRYRGYSLLYYLIENIGAEYKNSVTLEDFTAEKEFDAGKNEYTRRFYDCLISDAEDKKTRLSTQDDIILLCRKMLKEKSPGSFDKIRNGFTPALMKCVEAADKNHAAFWNIFRTDEILGAVSGDDNIPEVEEYVK